MLPFPQSSLFFYISLTVHLAITIFLYTIALIPLLRSDYIFYCVIDINMEALVFLVLMKYAMYSLMVEQNKIILSYIAPYFHACTLFQSIYVLYLLLYLTTLIT